MSNGGIDLKSMSIGVAIGFTASAAAVAAYAWFKSSAPKSGGAVAAAAAAGGPLSAKQNKQHFDKDKRANFRVNAVPLQQWVSARTQLMSAERELTRQIDAVAAARKQLPFTEVQDYVFADSDGGKGVRLSELFGDKTELAVWHMMYDGDWKNACSSCSFWLDGINGQYRHIKQRTAFAAIAKASPQQLATLKQTKGWAFPVVSARDNTFNADFKVEDKATYNFGHGAAEDHPPVSQYPGMSVFYRDPHTGKLYRTYSAYARGFELTNGAWGLFDTLPFGREGFWPKHDYTAAPAVAAK